MVPSIGHTEFNVKYTPFNAHTIRREVNLMISHNPQQSKARQSESVL